LNGLPARLATAPIQAAELDFEDRTETNLAALRQYIERHQIQHLYLTDKPYTDRFYRTLRAWGIRAIVNHDHMPGERPPAGFLARVIKSAIHGTGLISCDRYIGVSQFVCDRLIRNACIPASRVTRVLNGIEPIAVDPTLRHYAHDTFHIPREALIVVSVGRATYYKGIDFLIECARDVLSDSTLPPVVFLYCGHGPDLEAFQKMANGYKLGERFLFAGRREDIRQILPSCDIAIQASRGEAFSLAILEYLSSGLATIVPDSCGNGEAVSSGENGFLYPSGDRTAAVNKLKECIKDSELRTRLAAAGRQSVRERFSITRASQELAKVVAREFAS
jgi:glycosyltransferase involved in cell wall biosynthesis